MARGSKHPRWKKPYTELTYFPMQEVLKHLRANGYKTYIVTGGGQDFVRVYAEQTYGVPPNRSSARRSEPSMAMPRTVNPSLPRNRSSCPMTTMPASPKASIYDRPPTAHRFR